MADDVILLSVSIGTTVVGWLIFVYMRHQKGRAKSHILRSGASR